MDKKASTLRSVIIVLGSSWLTLFINLARVLVLPVKLGDAGMGQVTLAISFTGFFIVFTVLGTSTYLVRAVARDNTLLDSYISNALLLRGLMGLAVFAASLGMTQLLGYTPEMTQVILIVAVGVFISNLSNVFESGLQGLGQMSWRSIVATVANVCTTVLGVGLVLAGADPATYALSFPVGSLIMLAGVGVYYLRHRPIRWSFDFKVAHALLIGGLPLFLWAFLQTAYGQIDATLLSVIAVGHIEVVGWFGVATQITSVIVMVPLAINAVALPVLCEMHVNSRERFEAAATRTMVSSLLLLAPAAVGLALAAPDVIQLLHYPVEFAHSIPVLALLAIAMPVTGALMVLSTMATAIGQERQWIKISLFAVCIFPPLYIILISLFQTNLGNGAIGAAVANLIGESALLVWAWFILPGELRPLAMVWKGAQVAGLAALMGGVVLAVQQMGAPLLVYAPLGALVYGAGAWLLKLITAGDVALIRNALLRRRRRGEQRAASSEQPVVSG